MVIAKKWPSKAGFAISIRLCDSPESGLVPDAAVPLPGALVRVVAFG
jgi:hypothetical protein